MNANFINKLLYMQESIQLHYIPLNTADAGLDAAAAADAEHTWATEFPRVWVWVGYPQLTIYPTTNFILFIWN